MPPSIVDDKLAPLPRFLGTKLTADQPGILCWSGLTLAEAEAALDWLEGNGYLHTRLEYHDGEAFAVRALTASHARPAVSVPAAASGAGREERRTAPRALVRRALCCHLLAWLGEESYPARVDNLSAEGVSLILKQHFEPGAFVPLRLEHEMWKLAYRRVLRVAHFTRQTDGFAILGGEFTTRLSLQELRALLW